MLSLLERLNGILKDLGRLLENLVRGPVSGLIKNVRIHKGVALEGMVQHATNQWELKLRRVKEEESFTMRVQSVILATGGFGADSGANGLLQEQAPNLMKIKTTTGKFTTGDGIKLGRNVGAKTIDMDLVQVHPTAFSDTPTGFKASAGSPLILCAEILRGVGGVLLDASGDRFIDELEKRDTVTAAMNARMGGQGPNKNFLIALPPSAAKKVKDHVHIYSSKGLLHKVDGVEGVAQALAPVL